MAIMSNNECLKQINQDILCSHLMLNKGRSNMLCIVFRYNTAQWKAKVILKFREVFSIYDAREKKKKVHCTENYKTQQKIQSRGEVYCLTVLSKSLVRQTSATNNYIENLTFLCKDISDIGLMQQKLGQELYLFPLPSA